MTIIETCERLSEIVKFQAEIIQKQAEVIAQNDIEDIFEGFRKKSEKARKELEKEI